MGDVQRRSVEAASALVERLVASVDGDAGPRDGAGEEGQERPSVTDDALAGFARLWRDSVSSLAAALPGSAGGAAAPYIDVSAPGVPPSLRVTLHAESRTGTADVWLHNPSGDAIDKLRVHCGPLQSHDGTVLAPMSVTAEPDGFDLPARSSRGVQLTVDVGDARPGTYRAIVLVEGLPEQWMPLEVIVPEPTG